jgi:hypothetical protein
MIILLIIFLYFLNVIVNIFLTSILLKQDGIRSFSGYTWFCFMSLPWTIGACVLIITNIIDDKNDNSESFLDKFFFK